MLSFFVAYCAAYWAEVSPPCVRLGLCSLKSRRQLAMQLRALSNVENQCSLSHSSRSRPLNDSA